MNYRKGLTRALIAWLALWAIVGGWGWFVYDSAQKGMLAILKGDNPFHSYNADMMAYYNANSEWGLKLAGWAIVAGVLLPIGAAISYAVGRWIYRGFKATG